MLQNVFIAVLFACSACAMHLEYLNMQSTGEELQSLGLDQYQESDFVSEVLNEVLSEVLSEVLPETREPITCQICMWIVKTMKKKLVDNAKADVIKNKLHHVCDKSVIFKDKCKKFVTKYMDSLTNELSTDDGPKTACVKIRLCKAEQMQKIIQDSQTYQQL